MKKYITPRIGKQYMIVEQIVCNSNDPTSVMSVSDVGYSGEVDSKKRFYNYFEDDYYEEEDLDD